LDVLLVQFLLGASNHGIWWSINDDPTDLLPAVVVPRGMHAVGTPVLRKAPDPLQLITHPKPPGNIILDGICGDQTIGYIEWFQEEMQLARLGKELNGQVAPWQMGGPTTMSLLNHVLKLSPKPWILELSGLYPIELQSSFYSF